MKKQNEYEYEDEDYENENEYEYENQDDDDETIDQNVNKKLNDYFGKIIDKSRSFEDQIELSKKSENLGDYYYSKDFDDKELKLKNFKQRLVHLSNKIKEKLFEKIFGHTLIKLVDKLISTKNNEENQIIVKNNLKSKDKIFEKYYFDDWVTESSDQRINLKDAIDLILDFNENEYENKYENEDEDDYYENENENKDEEDETIDQNEIKKINDYFDKLRKKNHLKIK